MSIRKAVTAAQGFSLPELMIAMLLITMLSGILIIFFSQSRLALDRGLSKTELQQRTRMAAIRIIPKITSVVRRPPSSSLNDPHPDGILPIVDPTPSLDPITDPGELQIVLNSTKEFVKDQLRETVTPDDEFNPRGTPEEEYDLLRIWFEPQGQDPRDARLGQVGVVNIDRNTPNDEEDDIEIAHGLNFVSFLVYPDNRRVRLRVRARGLIRNATSGTSVDESVYETDIYLPVFTNSSGGMEEES